MPKRVTEAFLREALSARPIEMVQYAGTVTGKSKFRCLTDGCGHEWVATTDNVVRGGRGCPACGRRVHVVRADEGTLTSLGVSQVTCLGGKMTANVFKCLAAGCGHQWQTSVYHLSRGRKCPLCVKRKKEVAFAKARSLLLKRDIELLSYSGVGDKQAKFRCLKDGHEWATYAYDVLQGQGCLVCSGLGKMALVEVVSRIGDRPIDVVEYGGSSSASSRFRCKIDGYEWTTTVNSVLHQGSGCAKCAGMLAYTEDQVKEYAAGRNLDLLKYGGGVNKKSVFRCVTHNKTFESTLVSLRKRKGCSVCSGVKRDWTLEDVNARAAKKGVVCVGYGGYLSARSRFKCLKDSCGYEWVTSGAHVKGCPKCSGTLALSEEVVAKRVEGRGLLIREYSGNTSSNSSWECAGCGTVWEAPADRVLNQGSGCPSCAVYGFNPAKPAYFYVYKIVTGAGTYMGFGITSNLKIRNYSHTASAKKARAKIQLLHNTLLPGPVAKVLERHLIDNFSIVDTGVFGFRREAVVWSDHDYETLVAKLSEAANNAKRSQDARVHCHKHHLC